LQLQLIIDTHDLDIRLRPLLSLYFASTMESPLALPPDVKWHGKNATNDGVYRIVVHEDGWTWIPQEIVVQQTEQDLQATWARPYFISGSWRYASIGFRV
jgi:hypothetical protein